jgi:hypothetical protein
MDFMISGQGVAHSERGEKVDLQPFPGETIPTTSCSLELWMAFCKEGENVEPSFHQSIMGMQYQQSVFESLRFLLTRFWAWSCTWILIKKILTVHFLCSQSYSICRASMFLQEAL